MDFEVFLKPEIQNFINANLNADLHSLLLKKSPFEEVTMQELVQQIQGLQIGKKKFPSFIKEGVVFPPKLNLEQTSSENTALYKAQQIKGERWLDLTSGLGIDSFFMGQKFSSRTLVEQNEDLVPIVEHNFKVWEKPVQVLNVQLEDFLTHNQDTYDVVYLDPARRDQSKRKVFLLEDLSPNILEIYDQLLSIGKIVVIKLSPLIDLHYLIEVLPEAFKIEILSVKNEVKEVVVYLRKESATEPKIHCINLESKDAEFSFYLSEEKEIELHYHEVQKFLYLPNSSIAKAGAFKTMAKMFNLNKLQANSHAYTSNILLNDFPGRIWEVEEINNKQIKKGEYYNIITKNYPVKPEDLKKKFKTKDGGADYLIFTEDTKGKKILKGRLVSNL